MSPDSSHTVDELKSGTGIDHRAGSLRTPPSYLTSGSGGGVVFDRGSGGGGEGTEGYGTGRGKIKETLEEKVEGRNALVEIITKLVNGLII